MESHFQEKAMKVLVCQRGARHRYAIPRLLEEENLLAALYTDSSAYSGLGRVATGLARLGFQPASARSLTSRVPQGIPPKKVFSSDMELGVILPRQENYFGLGHVYKRWGLQGATIIYSMYGENRNFLEWARQQGAKIIMDVFVHPGTNRIVADEEARIFGKGISGFMDKEDEHSRRMFELADLLLCPSEWVASGVRSFSPEHAHKIRILPYGSSVVTAGSVNAPKPGRILFAGRDPLRKGLHYLAEAAWLLRQEGFQIDVRIAGVGEEDISWIAHRDELTCLGAVPMEKMQEEYAAAEVFVLPSLSEGQAGVLLEAMACGCAVVATKESGVDFEPGCGVTVPARDAVSLADAIKKTITNDGYRTGLAQGALRQSQLFSMAAWKNRLVEAVKSMELSQ